MPDNFIQRITSSSLNFLNFFGEAGQATTANGNPAIEFGDYIIIDTCPTRRFESGEILQKWLMEMAASIIYTPSLSPEFNAAEFVLHNRSLLSLLICCVCLSFFSRFCSVCAILFDLFPSCL